ncbi:MAG: IclR family transcriptional regulator [Cardiobacteriaceae bacterium]|nr:IclR family transcriptional regulator [Cardiobacteriaceae bacterium]
MNILERAFMVSAYVNAAGEPVSPRQLVDALDIPLSTVYRLITQLKTWGYVCDSIHSGCITSGPLFLHHGGNYARFSLLAHTARDGLRQLGERTGETAAVIIATPVQTVCVDMVESTQRLRCSFAVGEAQSPVRGSSAKTLLAWRSIAERDQVIDRLLPREEAHALREELAVIRARGYGQSLGEVDVGIWGASAPLLRKQQLQGVLTVMVPHPRVAEKGADFFTDAVVQAAASINELIALHA